MPSSFASHIRTPLPRFDNATVPLAAKPREPGYLEQYMYLRQQINLKAVSGRQAW
ncbi:hypothetical protein ACRALDRAFT_2015796 [Sodiomyces alcalophilus JCM 7366]|uniref:uncharacterized protein n=1 Tax=Sodiomyces alcalophilus JCM 7366 TaxID=591952 RepID=UPI0039B63145